MNTLPMIPEPLEMREYWITRTRYYRVYVCPAWGCNYEIPEACSYLEHLRSHRYEPFTMEIPR